MKKLLNSLKPLTLILFPALLFYIFQCFIELPVKSIRTGNALYTVLIMETLCLSIIMLTGFVKVPLLLTGIFFLVLGIAENYIFRFRTTFLTPMDLFSSGTALNVAKNYNFTPSGEMVAVTVFFLIWFAAVILLSPGKEDLKILKNYFIRVSAGIVLFLIFCGMVFYVRSYNPKSEGILSICGNDLNSFKNNAKEGALIRLLYDSGRLSVKVPDGYDRDEAAAIVRDDPEEIRETLKDKELPDIVVVMSESFADPRAVGPLETSTDYMPFVHSLQEGHENTVTGTLNVSIIGGNTPNTEYEFLTGNSLAFLPRGCIPFQQYLSKDVYAMPRYLSDLGYDTVAMHPFESDGWNRTEAYPSLGFKDMKFLEYFEDKSPEYVRDYISDSSFSRAIEEEVEGRNDSAPVFSFNVTMQNHASYAGEYDNLKKDVKVLNAEGAEDIEELESYLSLIKLSDAAFKEMVEYYEKVDRKTIVLFFGDHQPALINFDAVLKNIGTDVKNFSDETALDTYKVPFVIWANYDIEEEKGLETSVNYLGNLLLNKAGIPLDGYRRFIEQEREELPVLSFNRTVDKDGVSRTLNESTVDLSEYKRLQYYEMFDK